MKIRLVHKRSLSIVFLMIAGFLLTSSGVSGQKFLQLDKFGKKKSMKIFIGEELNFRLSGEEFFYSLIIRDLIPETNKIIFDNGEVNVEDVAEIRHFRNKGAVKAWNLLFLNFGIGWALFSAIDALAGGTFHLSAVIISGAAIAVGFLIKAIFTKRKFKISDKRGLRIIDMNVGPISSDDRMHPPPA